MDFLTKLGFALAVGGIGVSIAVYFATYLWRDMPKWTAISGFGFGILLCLGAILCFIVIPAPPEPEVTMRLVNLRSPSLVLDNHSDAIARDIKRSYAIWNTDDLRTYIVGSSGDDPLPIPTSTFDVLRPHTSSGPEGIFQASINAGYIKKGDKLIGSIGIICPICVRGHSYFIYIIWGESGWFSEIQDLKEGELTISRCLNTENLKAYFTLIELIPGASRHQIAESN